MQASAPTTHQSYFTKFSSTTPFDQIFWEKFYALPKHILVHKKKHHLITINLKYSMQGEHVFNQPQSSIVWYFFLCQKNMLWSPLFENISCKTSCFLITRNHRLLIFGQKSSVITIGEKYFMHNLLFFNRPRSSIVCCSFCVKKTPFIHNFWKIFHELQKCQRSSFICFFSLAISPSTLIGSKFFQT